MSPIAISVALLVAAVGPTDGRALDPEFVAVTSRGAALTTPLSSITVAAMAPEFAVLTVTFPVVGMLAAFAAYHISASVFRTWTEVALTQELALLSVMLLTDVSALFCRTSTMMTSMSPVVVEAGGDRGI